MSQYCDPADLDDVIENFTGDFFGTGTDGTTLANNFITKISGQIDERLRGIASVPTVPIGTQMDGQYPPSVKRVTAIEAVRQKLISRIGLTIDEETQRRLDLIYAEQENIYTDLENGRIVFAEKPSSQEGDISPSYIVSKAGAGQCISNHDGWGGLYSGTDYERFYRIKITTAGAVNEAVFDWSNDDGVSWNGSELTAGTDWTEIENNLYVRFTGTASADDFKIDDTWRIHCVPSRIAPESGRNVRIKHFVRG